MYLILNYDVIYFLLVYLLAFCQKSRCLPTYSELLFNNVRIKIPQNCIAEFRNNPLLHPENLPQFSRITASTIKTGLKCATEIYEANQDGLTSKDIHNTLSMISAVILYIRVMKSTLLKNKFDSDLYKAVEEMDTEDIYQQLIIKYNALVEQYAFNLYASRGDFALMLTEMPFEPKNEILDQYLISWTNNANSILGMSVVEKNVGPWFVPYNELEVLYSLTESDKIKKEARQQYADYGRRKHFDNRDVINDLRKLYNRYVGIQGYKNIADFKSKYCMFQSYDYKKKFLKTLEYYFAIKEMDDPSSFLEYKIASNYISRYFRHTHVVKKLFEIIYEFFDIVIAETKLPYEIYTSELKLYEANISNKRVGMFYIDYLARSGEKKASAPYTVTLRKRMDEVQIIPLVFISLQTQSIERFSLEEVRDLFHEMGHCLQHILLAAPQKLNTYTDVHEFPSMFMEHFAMKEHIIRQLSAEDNRMSRDEYDKYMGAVNKYFRYLRLRSIQNAIIDLDLFGSSETGDCVDIVNRARKDFKYKGSFDKTFGSVGLTQFNYAGTYYVYIVSEIMASHAYDHMTNDFFKEDERRLDFRKFVFEMEGVSNLTEAFQKFVKEDMDAKYFLHLYDIDVEELNSH